MSKAPQGRLRKRNLKVNFINILRAAYMCADPESAKKTDNLTVFFALLGSVCIKAARKMLEKLTLNLLFGFCVTAMSR